jgi:pimeloyl-ACP methyl ester carboxylesterase
MAEIERNGVRLRYDVFPGGPATPVLLTHGYSATRAMHAQTVPALTPQRTCITWDVRGHGDSDYPPHAEQYSIPLTIDDMRAILDAEGLDRAVLLGHSMGGFLSLTFQRTYPERVAGLVLVGTGPGYRRDDGRAGWNKICEAYATTYEQRGLDGMSDSDEVRVAHHRSADGLILAARGILRQHDAEVIDHLSEIDVPVLLIAGAEDRPFIDAMNYMAKKIPNAQMVTIDGAGHAPMLTHADVYNDALVDFLDRAESHQSEQV